MAASSNLDDVGEFGVPTHVIQKNQREQIRIGMGEYKGREFMDVRLYYQAPDGWRPSKQGVTLSPDRYHELLRGILELGVQLDRLDQSVLSAFDDRDAPAGASTIAP